VSYTIIRSNLGWSRWGTWRRY